MTGRFSSTRRPWFTAATFVLLAMAQAAPAWASGGGGHCKETYLNWWSMTPGPCSGPAVGWLLVDFVIFIGIIYLVARKPLVEFLRGRALTIQRSLEEAQQAKAEAEARALELEQRLKDLDKEVAGLRDELRDMGERERQQLEEDGKKAAERMSADTEAQIASELARARAALKAEAVRLAMELAEQKLQSTLGADDYRALNKEFVVGLRSVDSQPGSPS